MVTAFFGDAISSFSFPRVTGDDRVKNMENTTAENSPRKIWQITLSIYRYVIGVNILTLLIMVIVTDSLIVLALSLVVGFFAVKWGIQKVLKNGAIESRHSFKISILVGVVPIVVGLLFGTWAILRNLIFISLGSLFATNSWGTAAALVIRQLNLIVLISFILAVFFSLITWFLLWKFSVAPKPPVPSLVLKAFLIFFSILVIVFLEVAILAGLILWSQNISLKDSRAQETQQKQQISNWQTYRNERLGFEVKYPQEWFLCDENHPPCTFSNTVYLNRDKIEFCPIGDICPTDFKVFIETSTSLPDTNEYDTYTPFLLDDAVGVLNFYTETSELPRRRDTRIYVNYGDFQYRITFPNIDKLGNHEQIYDQILSTFQFIE